MWVFLPVLFVQIPDDPATIPMGWPACALCEMCVADRQGLDLSDPAVSQLSFVSVENVESNTGAIDLNSDSRTGSKRTTTFRFNKRHIL